MTLGDLADYGLGMRAHFRKGVAHLGDGGAIPVAAAPLGMRSVKRAFEDFRRVRILVYRPQSDSMAQMGLHTHLARLLRNQVDRIQTAFEEGLQRLYVLYPVLLVEYVVRKNDIACIQSLFNPGNSIGFDL